MIANFFSDNTRQTVIMTEQTIPCTFRTNGEQRRLQISDLCHVNVRAGLFHGSNSRDTPRYRQHSSGVTKVTTPGPV